MTTTDLETRLRSVEDRLELTELFARYGRGLDTHDTALLADVFTEDLYVEHGAVTPPVHGRDAFLDLVLSTLPSMRYVQHYVTNVEVDVDGDEAEARAFVLAIHDVELDGEPAQVPAGAAYHAGARRTETGWRFHRLIVEETWMDARIPQLYGMADHG